MVAKDAPFVKRANQLALCAPLTAHACQPRPLDRVLLVRKSAASRRARRQAHGGLLPAVTYAVERPVDFYKRQDASARCKAGRGPACMSIDAAMSPGSTTER